MMNQNTLTLINPQNGNLAFRVLAFEDAGDFELLQKNNFYSLVWLKEGSGELKSNFSSYAFDGSMLFAFSPYQPFLFSASKVFKGVALHFHPDFFCIHKHHNEVACNGVLFNNIYQPPFTAVDESASETFGMLIEQMKNEVQKPALAQYELLISYLKIFLITASRLKLQTHPEITIGDNRQKEPFILQRLKDVIEKDFRARHSASHYAKSLHISVKALSRITKAHLNKTLTELISERIVIEAKRELYLTDKAVKEIAYELGYEDEYYFSRFFKANAEVSPQAYRETVGFGRGSD
jgi:AraC-like DNA-binding protein